MLSLPRVFDGYRSTTAHAYYRQIIYETVPSFEACKEGIQGMYFASLSKANFGKLGEDRLCCHAKGLIIDSHDRA